MMRTGGAGGSQSQVPAGGERSRLEILDTFHSSHLRSQPPLLPCLHSQLHYYYHHISLSPSLRHIYFRTHFPLYLNPILTMIGKINLILNIFVIVFIFYIFLLYCPLSMLGCIVKYCWKMRWHIWFLDQLRRQPGQDWNSLSLSLSLSVSLCLTHRN